MKKKLLAMLLTLCMALSLLPASALAAWKVDEKAIVPGDTVTVDGKTAYKFTIADDADQNTYYTFGNISQDGSDQDTFNYYQFTNGALSLVDGKTIVWAAESLSYTIALDANGGTLTGASSVTTNAQGKLASLPDAPTHPDGKEFAGWFDAATGGNEITTETVFEADGTIYAQWTDTAAETVETPVIAPASKTLTEEDNGKVTLKITCATEGAKIYYTTDGTDPTSSSTEYTEGESGKEISVTETMTVKAIAVKEGMKDSEVVSATYTVVKIDVENGKVETGASETVDKVTVDTSVLDENASALATGAAENNDGVVEIAVNDTVTDETLQAKTVDVPLSATLLNAVKDTDGAEAVKVALTANVAVTLPVKAFGETIANVTLNVKTTGKGIDLKLDNKSAEFEAPIEVSVKVTVDASVEAPVIAHKDGGRFFRVRQRPASNGLFSFFTRHFSEFEVVDANRTEAAEMDAVVDGMKHTYSIEQDEALVVAVKDTDGTLAYLAVGPIAEEMGESTYKAPFVGPDAKIGNVCAVIGDVAVNSDGTVDLTDPATVIRVDPAFGELL